MVPCGHRDRILSILTVLLGSIKKEFFLALSERVYFMLRVHVNANCASWKSWLAISSVCVLELGFAFQC